MDTKERPAADRYVAGVVTRPTVFGAINGERAYQEMRKGRDGGAEHHSVEEFLLFMEDYLLEARKVASRTWGKLAKPNTLDVIRKVVGLGVACMESNGVVYREGFNNSPVFSAPVTGSNEPDSLGRHDYLRGIITFDQAAIVQSALDELGIALADHGHQWTPEQRNLYEKATRFLGGEPNPKRRK